MSLGFLAGAERFAVGFVPVDVRENSITYIRISAFAALTSATEYAVSFATRSIDRPDVPLMINSTATGKLHGFGLSVLSGSLTWLDLEQPSTSSSTSCSSPLSVSTPNTSPLSTHKLEFVSHATQQVPSPVFSTSSPALDDSPTQMGGSEDPSCPTLPHCSPSQNLVYSLSWNPHLGTGCICG